MASLATTIRHAGHQPAFEEVIKKADVGIEVFDIPDHRTVYGESFPLGLRLQDGANVENIEAIVQKVETAAESGIFDRLLSQHGVILFRGFPIRDAYDFSKFVKAFRFPQPHQEVGLAGKRSTITADVKTANEEPPDVKFYFHSEYGRSAHFPGVLFFYSEIVPQQGGRTPLLSSYEIFDRLKDELPGFVNDLIEKGVIGRQYFPSKDDPDAEHIGWNWKDSYGFEIQPNDSLDVQREKVAKVLHDVLQAEAEWQPNGALHVLQRLPAVRRVESTGRLSFFNGFAGVYGRAKDNHALEPPYRGLDQKYHLPTTYGDGSPIPTHYLDRLLELSDEIGFLVPWEEGDVALIDNYTVQPIWALSLACALTLGWQTITTREFVGRA